MPGKQFLRKESSIEITDCCRITHQGENHQQIPWAGLRCPGLRRPRQGSSEEQPDRYRKGFEPTYLVMESKKKVIADLKKAAARGSDPRPGPGPRRRGDRLACRRGDRKEETGPARPLQRPHAGDHPRRARPPPRPDFNLYEAQQTRRILTARRLSDQPPPGEKVKRGLSAGRVQSVAVRIICDREAEIRKFVPRNTGTSPHCWRGRIRSLSRRNSSRSTEKGEGRRWKARRGRRLAEGGAVHRFIRREEGGQTPAARPFHDEQAPAGGLPLAPFFGKKTMTTAQKLYEGIELGAEGSVGLITYMRTDSSASPPRRSTTRGSTSTPSTTHRACLPRPVVSSRVPPRTPTKRSGRRGPSRPSRSRRSSRPTSSALPAHLEPFSGLADEPRPFSTRPQCRHRRRQLPFPCAGLGMRFPGFTVVYTGGQRGQRR